MRLKIRTHDDNIDGSVRATSIIYDNGSDIISRSVMIDHYRYYCIVTVNKFTEWSHNDRCMVYNKKYEVKK